ncbi:uncharacterized protein [Antedon mediterranea]|uniref:uncharacterized protein n=1 Tax=Antedon mediterranea TaxID=105859 RepID=UPI003AF7180F
MSNKNDEVISASLKFEVNANDDTGVTGIHKALEDDAVGANMDNIGCDVEFQTTNDKSEKTMDFTPPKMSGKKKSVNFIQPVNENTSKSSKKKGKKKSKGKSKKSASEKAKKNDDALNKISETAQVSVFNDEARIAEINLEIDRPTCSKEVDNVMSKEATTCQVDAPDEITIEDKMDGSYTHNLNFMQEENTEVMEEVETKIILPSSDKEHVRDINTAQLLEELSKTINSFSELQEENPNNSKIEITSQAIEEVVSIERIEQNTFDIQQFEDSEICTTKERNVESPGKSVHFELDMENDMNNSDILNKEETEINTNLANDDLACDNLPVIEDNHNIENNDAEIKGECKISDASSSPSSSSDDEHKEVTTKKMKKRKRRIFNFHFPKFGNKKKKNSKVTVELMESDSVPTTLIECPGASNEIVNGEGDSEITIQSSVKEDGRSDECKGSSEVDLKTDNTSATGGKFNIPTFEGCLEISNSENVELNLSDNSKQEDFKLNDKPDDSGESISKEQITQLELQEDVETTGRKTIDLQMDLGQPLDTTATGQSDVNEGKEETKNEDISANVGIHMSGLVVEETDNIENNSSFEKDSTKFEDANVWVNMNLDMDTNKSDAEKLLESGGVSQPTTNFKTDNTCQSERNISLNIGNKVDIGNQGEDDLYPMELEVQNCAGVDISKDIALKSNKYDSKIEEESNLGSVGIDVGVTRNNDMDQFVLENGQKIDIVNDAQTSCITQEIGVDAGFEGEATEGVPIEDKNLEIQWTGKDIASSSTSSDDEVLKLSKGKKRKKKKTKKKTKKNKGIFGSGFARQISGGKKEKPDLESLAISPDIEGDNECIAWQEIPKKAQVILGTDRIEAAENIKPVKKEDHKVLDLGTTMEADSKESNTENKIVHIKFARAVSNCSDHKPVTFDDNNGDKTANKSEDLRIDVDKEDLQTSEGIESENKHRNKKKKGFFSGFHMPGFGSKHKKGSIDMEESIDNCNIAIDINIQDTNKGIVLNNDKGNSETFIKSVSILDDDKEFSEDRYRPAVDDVDCEISSKSSEEDKHVFDMNLKERNNRKIWNMKDTAISDSSSENIDAETEVSPEISFNVPGIERKDVDCNIGVETPQHLDCDLNTTSINVDPKFTVVKDSNFEGNGEIRDLDKDVDESCLIENESNLDILTISDNCEINNQGEKNRFSGFNIHIPHFGGRKNNEIELSQHDGIDVDIMHPELNDSVCPEESEIDAIAQATDVNLKEEIDVKNHSTSELKGDVSGDFPIDISTTESSDLKEDGVQLSSKHEKKKKGLFAKGIQFPKFGGKKHRNKMIEIEESKVDTDIPQSNQINDTTSSIEKEIKDADAEVQISVISTSLNVDVELNEDNFEEFETPEFGTDFQQKELECIPEEGIMENDNVSKSRSSSSDDITDHNDDNNAKNKKKGFFSGINIHLPSFSWKRNKGVVDCDLTPIPGVSDQVQSGVGLSEEKPGIEGTIEIQKDTSIEADIDADIDIEVLKTDIDPGVLHLEDRDVLALDTIEENPDIEDLSLKATIDEGITINSDVEIGAGYDDGNGNKEKEIKKSKPHKKKGLLGGIHIPRIGDKKKKDNLIDDLTTCSPDVDIKAEHDKRIDTNNLVVSELPESNLDREELQVCMPDVDARVQSQKLRTNAVVETNNEVECQLPEVLDYPTEDAEIKIDVDENEIKLHPQLHININMDNKGENIDIPTQNLEMENVPKHETENINVTVPDIGNVLLNKESSSIVSEGETPELHTSAEINIDQPETKEISNYNINLGIETDLEDATKLDTCRPTLQDIQDSEVNVDNPILFENEVDANIKLSEPTTKNGVDSYDLGESQPLSVNLKTDIDEIVKTKLESDIQIVKQPSTEKLQTEYYIQQSEKSATLPQTKLDFKPRVSRGISIEGSVKMRLRKGSSEPELSSPKLKKKKKRFTLPSFNFPNLWNRKNKTNKINMDTENLRRPKSMEVLPSSTNGVDEDFKIEPRPLSLSLPISIEEEDSTLLPSSSVDIEPARSLPDISVDKSLQVKNLESEIDGGQLDEVINSKPKKKIKMPSLNFKLSKSKKEKVYKEKIVIDLKDELDGVDMQKPIISDVKLKGEADTSDPDLSLNASGLELPSDRENISTSVEDVVDTIELRPQIEGQERNNLDMIKIDTAEHKQVDVIIKDSHEPLKLNISSTGGGITDINKDLPSPAFTASDSGLSSGVGEGEVSLPGFGCPEEFSVNAGISAEVDPSADVSAMETSCSSQADEDIKSSSSSHSLVEKNKRKGFRLPKISFSGKRKSKTLPAVVSPSGTVKAHNYSLSSDDSVSKLSKGKKRKDLKDESIFDDTDEHLKLSGDVSFNLEDGPSTSTPLKSVHRNNSNACDPENAPELPEDPSILPIQFTTTYKVVIAIDFGSTFSGYAYCFPTNPEEIFVMRKWQGGDPGVWNTKMPSTLLLTPEGEFHSFGFVARDFYHDMEHKEAQKWLYFDNFKMPLHTNQNLDLDTEIEAGNGIHVPAIKLFELALAFFKDRALKDVSDRSDHHVDQQDIRWVLTVPAIWKQQAKQFIRKATYLAGIGSPSNPDQLTIALEPEAASIYIRQLKKTEFVPDKSKRKSIIEVENMNASLYTVPENLTKGCRYIVVDCGGGTVDITVHQIEDHNGLVEVHRASGGTFGSISVDRQFQKLLVEICGQDFIDEFKVKRPAGWVDLMIAFEARKRNIQPWKSNPLNVSLPFSFIDYYKKFTKTSTVENALKDYNSEDVKWSPQGMIRFSLEGMQSLFQPSINNITECIEQVLNEPNIGNISHLFIVGGFAESPFVKNTIRNQFQDRLQVIIPPDVTMAVLKGAVMYGMDPTVIRVRKSKLTYGVGVLNKFDSQKHPQKKKVVKDNVEWCLDVFDKLVEVDQAVQTGEKVCRSYTPAKPDQKEILISIYCSEKKNVKFITDAGVKKFGTLKIDLSMIEQLNDLQRREIRLTMQYGDTEIKVSALDVLTGHCVKVNIDFEENVN